MKVKYGVLRRKLFGADYDDITVIPRSYARDDVLAERSVCENLPIYEKNSSLIGHDLKIFETDKAMQSDKVSECWNWYTCGSIPFRDHDLILHKHGVNTSSEATRCRVEAEIRLGKQQTQELNLCTSKLRDWEGNDTKKMLDKNVVTRYDHPFKMFDENEVTFSKNDMKVKQTRQAGEIQTESLTKINIYPSIIHKIESGFQIPLENIGNGTSETFKKLFTRLKQSPPVNHRPPYHFMVTPRISLYKINDSEPKIKKRIDKDAIGDTTRNTDIKNVTNPYYGPSFLKRRLCTLTFKPQNNEIDLLMVAKAMRNLVSRLSLQSKSVSGRSKKIKKTNKKINPKVRQRSLKNCYTVKEKTILPKQGINLHPVVEVSKEKIVNNLNGINNLIDRTWEKTNASEKGKNNRNDYYVVNPPPTCGISLANHSLRRCFCALNLDKPHTKICCKSRESCMSRPVTKYQTNDINKASELRELEMYKRDISPGRCKLSHNLISHSPLDCKPEIIGYDKFGSTCQNTDCKKTSYYECKYGNVHGEYNPEEKVDKIEQNERHISHNLNIFEIDHSDTKPITRTIKNSIRHRMTDTKDQEIQNDKSNKFSETDNGFEKNVFVQSNFQNCCTLIDKDTLDNTIKKKCTSFWKENNPRKEHGINIDSFYQDNILYRDTLNDFDLSRNKSFSFTTIKQGTDTNFYKNHSDVPSMRQNKLSSYQDTKNMVFSRQPLSRKEGSLSDKPYLTHSISNKYRHDNSVVNLLHERPTECKTSSSSSSSMIGATSTTDSSHSFPREKYKNYRQSASHGINSGYYKSNFYALYINVKNTRKSEKKYKLEPYECEPYSCVPGKCNPIECDKLIKKRFMRNTSKTSSDDGTQSVSSGPAIIHGKNVAASTKGHPKYSAGRGAQLKTFPLEKPKKEAVRISSSFSFNIEFLKNTAPDHSIDPRREELLGRENVAGREKHPGKKRSKLRTRKLTSDKKHIRTRPTGEMKSTDKCKKTCPKCLNIGTICPCPKLHHIESQSEPEMQHVGINTQTGPFTLKLHKSGRMYRDRAVKAKKLKIKPRVYKEKGQKARAGYEPDYDTIAVADKEQNIRQRMPDLEHFECEADTCIPGKCDPYVCLERIKNRYKENRNDESSKQVTRIGSNFSFNVEFYKNRNGFDDKNKYSAAPLYRQNARAKNKGWAIDTEEDDVETPIKTTAKATGKSRNKKHDLSTKTVGGNVDTYTQSTKEYHHQDSQVNSARQQKSTKTAAILQRCFCTAKLYGIEVPKSLQKKKTKCVIL